VYGGHGRSKEGGDGVRRPLKLEDLNMEAGDGVEIGQTWVHKYGWGIHHSLWLSGPCEFEVDIKTDPGMACGTHEVGERFLIPAKVRDRVWSS
jgi:hypothetical protein